MKLLSTIAIVFCFAVFQAKAVRLERGEPKPLIDVQAPPQYIDKNDIKVPQSRNYYADRFAQARSMQQQRDLGDKLSQKLKDILQSINDFIDNLQQKAADSTRAFNLGNMFDKVKDQIENVGDFAGFQSPFRSQRQLSWPCTVMDLRPECRSR